MRKIISELCGINERTYYVWKNKSHIKLVNLINEYFSEEDIKEYLEEGKINKLERLEELLEIEKRYKQIIEITQNDFEERNAEFYIERMFDYYKVLNMTELSNIIKESQANISNWKVRNSINAVKKKCRRLGIYNEIFKDLK